MVYARIFLLVAVIKHLPLCQLDIKNILFYGVLEEAMYMQQPPSFIAQDDSCLVYMLEKNHCTI